MTKFKIGDKVVPISKSTFVGESLNNSHTWNSAKKVNQPFLYVNEIKGDIVCCGWRITSGDYFKESDLIPYVEFKEGDLMYVSDISMNDALQSKRERIYMGSVKHNHFFLDSNSKTYAEESCLIRWNYIIPIPPKITSITLEPINGHSVVVYNNRVVVGCTTVSREKVEEVLKNMELLSKD